MAHHPAGEHRGARVTVPPRASPRVGDSPGGRGHVPSPLWLQRIPWLPVKTPSPQEDLGSKEQRHRSQPHQHPLSPVSTHYPHMPPTHIFPRISWLSKPSWLALAGKNKEKDDVWDYELGEQLQLNPHTVAKQQRSWGPHNPLLTDPEGSTYLLTLGAWQASVTLGALSGTAILGERAATGLACPSEGKDGGRG